MSLRIVQLTDSHLLANEKEMLKGCNTNISLQKCLRLSIELKPEFLILTGDLSDDGSIESYKRINQYLESTGIQYMIIPGNHDNIDNLIQIFGETSYINKTYYTHGWNLIFLNSVVKNHVHGYFSQESLMVIQNTLKNNSNPAGIFLHHPPYHLCSALIDQYALKNIDEFWSELSNYSQIKFVSCGHVHQEYESERNGIGFYTSPSTSIQFTPKMESFKLDDLLPGIRFFELEQNGHYKTKICRLVDHV